MGLPIDDDYLYQTFSIDKPKNYDKLKEKQEAERAALKEQIEQTKEEEKGKDEEKETEEGKKKSLKNKLLRFFAGAPVRFGADSDF